MSTFWTGKRVLVTGAGGFIGSHLAERLIEEGAQLRAFIHYNSAGSRGWLDSSPLQKDIEFISGDICDRDCAMQAVSGQEYVFHLAALIAIPYSYQAPESYIRTNIGGTLNLLQAARQAQVARFLHTSTSEVYGNAKEIPITELHPLQGQSPYSASKIGADKIAEAFHLSFEVPVTTVRPFNTYGPRQSARAVIPTIITQLLAGLPVKLGNLLPTRDLNYVSNTVDGYLMAGESPRTVGETINFGSGREISIGDLVDLIGNIMAVEPVIVSDQVRFRPENSEVQRLLASNELAKSLIGWQPRFGLREGLTKTIEWLSRNKEIYRPETFSV